MHHSWSRFTGSRFALVFVSASIGRASEIPFSWQSTITPSSIPVDQASGGSLGLVGVAGASKYVPLTSWNDEHAIGATYLLAASDNATYTNRPFTLALKLTDGPSGLSDLLTFRGMVNGGGLDWPSVSFSNGVRSIPIGQDIYHIQVLDWVLNGLESYPYPDIFAKIDVSTASITPEPSSLLLATMALSVLGFARWRKLAAQTNKSWRTCAAASIIAVAASSIYL